jgi:pimeloyl-ACP methyl ester carboxylesterase
VSLTARRAMVALLVLALLVVGAGLVLGARSDRGGPSAPEPNPEARVAPEPSLQPFYDQELDWQPCEEGDVCAAMEVPLDYDDPDGRSLSLALTKVRATGRRQGTLVVNPGGPGAPGTDYAANAATFFGADVLRRLDVVGFDPRGVGDSEPPLDCLDDRELDAYVATDGSPDSPAEVARLLAAARSMGEGCAADDRELAAHVSTVEVARDVDVLRALLEEERLTYFGASYGTAIGAAYAGLFPDRAGRLVLDGAVDTALSGRELALGQAAGFETALRDYVRSCLEASEACFLGDSVDEGLASIRDLLDRIDADPLPAGDRELTSGTTFYGIAAALYDDRIWGFLSMALRQARNGDGTLLLGLSDAYTSRLPTGGYASNSFEAFSAISCLDEPSTVPVEEIPGEVPAFQEVAPTLGRTFAWRLTGCAGQQVRSGEQAPDPRAAGAPPILVLGTTRDPATPYAWAVSLADRLESGVLVTREGVGHTGYLAGNECVDRAVEEYLLDGAVPEDRLTC